MCQQGKKRVFCRRGETPYSITSNNDKLMYTVNVSQLYMSKFIKYELFVLK